SGPPAGGQPSRSAAGAERRSTPGAPARIPHRVPDRPDLPGPGRRRGVLQGSYLEYPLLSLGHRLLSLGHRLLALGHPLLSLGHRLLALGHPLLSLAHPLLALGHPLLSLGHPQLSLGDRQLALGSPTYLGVVPIEGRILREKQQALTMLFRNRPQINHRTKLPMGRQRPQGNPLHDAPRLFATSGC